MGSYDQNSVIRCRKCRDRIKVTPNRHRCLSQIQQECGLLAIPRIFFVHIISFFHFFHFLVLFHFHRLKNKTKQNLGHVPGGEGRKGGHLPTSSCTWMRAWSVVHHLNTEKCVTRFMLVTSDLNLTKLSHCLIRSCPHSTAFSVCPLVTGLAESTDATELREPL